VTVAMRMQWRQLTVRPELSVTCPSSSRLATMPTTCTCMQGAVLTSFPSMLVPEAQGVCSADTGVH
jgi:hypothetical protein